MKKQFHKSVLAVSVLSVLGLMAGMSGSALADSATGTTSAVIVDSINISEQQQLSFGRFARTDTGGLITLDESTDACALTSPLPHFGNEACGIFKVTGAAGENFSIDYPDSASITNDDNVSMNYVPVLHDPGSDKTETLVLNPQTGVGESYLRFGGRLTVGQGQDLGIYTGNYVVSVDYINAN